MATPAISLAELRKKPHWSCSSITGFLTCSLAWAFRYVYREESGATPAALVFGGCIHKALAYAFQHRRDGHPVKTVEVQTLFADLLAQEVRISQPPILFDDEADVDTLSEKGRQMLGAYMDTLEESEQVLGVSVPFSVPLEDEEGERLTRPLIGEYDAVVAGENAAPVIVDWKTSRSSYSESQLRNHLQPTCYLYAHAHNGGRLDTRFRFDVMLKTKVPRVERSPTKRSTSDFLRLVELVRVIEKAVRHEVFIPSDQSWACKGCEYGMACQSWHKERSRSLINFKLAA